MHTQRRADLRFELSAVMPIAGHAAAATEHRQSLEDLEADRPGCPALVLVADHGVYLLSSGIPGQPGDEPSRPGWNRVVFADGWRPEQVDWDHRRAVLGGDDFAEYLILHSGPVGDALIDQLRDASARGFRWLYITVTEEAIELSCQQE